MGADVGMCMQRETEADSEVKPSFTFVHSCKTEPRLKWASVV